MASNQGFFGGGYNFMSPTTSTPAYDLSGLGEGYSAVKNAPKGYQGTYNPYQFSNPVAPLFSPYGTTSLGDIQDVYNRGFQASVAPIRAQSAERMRNLYSGFGGASRASSPAAKALMIQNAQKSGEDIQNAARSFGADMSSAMLGEKQKAREMDFARSNQVQDMMFKSEQDKQLNQANQNLQAAGFNRDQANWLATDSLNRATKLLEAGQWLPQFQMQSNQAETDAYMKTLDYLMRSGGI